ncbi:glycosyltransferase [Candidatus Nitrosotenuis cloacae]|uniref:UDP-glucuronosyltransferase n=1 Tax=Candidatus Nitrosotenuis cloacae TaxID=1603555 RepID=A0A3G1B275_9ARCH|nr:glycosyltransferase [Candidatus Nitrosotenuis cloacae]AJZ76228.1 UDP-glucuronosyltransferase [Candidatus Nitrosotenuis cloacae]
MNRTDVGFFCSPIGLGHATRDVAIADFLDRTSTKFVTGIGAAKLISEYGFLVNDKYAPPNFDVQNGALKGSLRWIWNYYQYYKDCKKISQKFINDESPKIVVSDEDFASLTIAQQKKIPTILITDILETNFTKGIGSMIEKKMNQSMKQIIQNCHTVIMPETGPDENNIRRVGPIVRQTKHTRDELRKRFAFDKNTITVSVGGTDAGKFLVDKVLEISPKLKDYDIILISGPALKIQNASIRNLGFVNNLHEIIYASDLVISLAGKSTIDESSAYGTPGIFIPIKGHFEQEDNARSVGYSFEDINKLESLIPQKIESERAQAQTDGAKKAAQIILNHISTNP